MGRYFPWLPDWRGQDVAIVASGPSAKHIDLSLLADTRTIAIKHTNVLFSRKRPPDMVYGCDGHWWRHARGLPDYRGIKVAHAGPIQTECPDLNTLLVEKRTDALITDRPGWVGSGGNSGFQALNIAALTGAKRILLIGFDMGEPTHWYGMNSWAGAANPHEPNFVRWRRAFDVAARQLAELRVEVSNASMVSTLACFRRVAMSEWTKAYSPAV